MNNATLPPGARRTPLPSTLSAPPTGHGLMAFLRRLSTLELLRLLTGAIVLSALLFWASAWSGAGFYRAQQETLQWNTTPNIVTAQEISTSLSEIDAATVRLLLIKSQNLTASHQKRAQILARRDDQRTNFSEALMYAAANTPYTDSEDADMGSLVELESGMHRYESFCAQALLFASQHKNSEALQAYQQAYVILQAKLLPAAQHLAQHNTAALRHADEQRFSVEQSAPLFDTAVLLLAGVLIGAQVFIALRTSRILNPCLLLATLLCCAMCQWTTGLYRESASQLHNARMTAFEPQRLLWHARASAAASYADQERALLIPSRGDYYRHAAREQLAQTAQTMNSYSWRESLLSQAFQQWRQSTSQRTDESELAYTRLATALCSATNTYQDAFDRSIPYPSNTLSGYEPLLTLGSLAIVALSGIGIWPRLKEYSS